MNGIYVAIALIVLVAALTFAVRKVEERKLVRLLGEGRLKEFFLESEGALCRMTIPAFNLAYMRLNAFIMQGDDAHARGYIESLVKAKASRAQHEDVVMKGFRYYVEHKEHARARELFEEIRSFEDEGIRREAQLLNDVFLEKGWNHIDEQLEAERSSAPGTPAHFNACYLLAAQYANKGDGKLAREYERKASASLLGE